MRNLLRLLSLSLTFIFISSISLDAQNNYNNTDSQGRRQGKWIDFHQNGKVRYEGEFENNEPVGTFLYYSEDGVMLAKNTYVKKSKISETEVYSPTLSIVQNNGPNSKGHRAISSIDLYGRGSDADPSHADQGYDYPLCGRTIEWFASDGCLGNTRVGF